jgi:cbb3-type cytochrome oxidase maturation protein
MTIVYVLAPLGLVFVLAAIGAFCWAAENGQFDDLDTPAERILNDEQS